MPRRGCTCIVSPAATYRAAHPEVAQARPKPKQVDSVVYRDFPFMPADIRPAAIRRALARRHAPDGHGGVALPDALRQRDFAGAPGHGLEATNGRMAHKSLARNVHRQVTPRLWTVEPFASPCIVALGRARASGETMKRRRSWHNTAMWIALGASVVGLIYVAAFVRS